MGGMNTPNASLPAYPQSDPYGRRSTADTGAAMQERTSRALGRGKRILFHRVKNGIHDPLTHFFVLDAVLHAKPDEYFQSVLLTKWLKANNQNLAWDTVTVGRVLSDIAESLKDACPDPERPPIIISRRWNGRYFAVSSLPVNRVMLHNLVVDLLALSEALITEEANGVETSRLSSPMLACPTVAL